MFLSTADDCWPSCCSVITGSPNFIGNKPMGWPGTQSSTHHVTQKNNIHTGGQHNRSSQAYKVHPAPTVRRYSNIQRRRHENVWAKLDGNQLKLQPYKLQPIAGPTKNNCSRHENLCACTNSAPHHQHSMQCYLHFRVCKLLTSSQQVAARIGHAQHLQPLSHTCPHTIQYTEQANHAPLPWPPSLFSFSRQGCRTNTSTLCGRAPGSTVDTQCPLQHIFLSTTMQQASAWRVRQAT